MTPAPLLPENTLFPKHLLGTGALSEKDIDRILDTAQAYVERNRQRDKKHPILRGLTQINLFYENSTRTRTSFELAGKRLGMDVINISADASSVKKGESLVDTALTLNAMRPDCIVIRHPASGAVQLFASYVSCPVINAGDGAHQHPTQALLDALTMRQHKGSIKGLNVTICGDILHSRVARSNALLLKTMGAHVTLVAPEHLMPAHAGEVFGCNVTHDMRKGLQDADIVMMLRVQQERMIGKSIPSVREYFAFYGLDRDKLSRAKPDALIMHPGPINRGVEIDSALADDIERSIILSQVENGVAIRQALLELMLQE